MNSIRIGEGNQPLICTPLVGKRRETIRLELQHILQKSPDLIEWRVDYFEDIANTKEVLGLAQEIKKSAGIPMIFTLRSVREGGQPIPLNDSEALKLLIAICQKTEVEYVDYELSNPNEAFKELRQASLESHTEIIGSYHNFKCTPELNILIGKIREAQQLNADVAKIAVMSRNLRDVLNLLQVTLTAKETAEIPLISLAMGQFGTITRMIGGVFGSAVTFAVGENSSAPGQIPIEALRSVLNVINQSVERQKIED